MSKQYKIDLHTHSIVSYDGGIREDEYKKLLTNNVIDFVAITDHNEIRFALMMQRRYGEQIIVGEEIMTAEGEIIGLFLKERIEPGLPVEETIQAIRMQRG